MKTLYTVSSVERLIADYLNAGGQMLQMREEINGCGDVLLYNRDGGYPEKVGTRRDIYDGGSQNVRLKTYVIHEVRLDEHTSGQSVRCYQRIPAKYQAMVDAQRREEKK